jgi:predicted secreted hydrolase
VKTKALLATALLSTAAAVFIAASAIAADGTGYAQVSAGHTLVFPQDLGSHPAFRTEWWYVTGWLKSDQGESLGFQVTFFRTKPDIDSVNPSAFAAHQLIIAHCALSDPKRGRLWQDQRIRRAGFGLAEAAEGDTHVWVEQWSLARDGETYSAKIDADEFSLELKLLETQAMLLQGEGGFSRKGPQERSASYYYSLPHLEVAGEILRKGAKSRVTGDAWLDHEWSSEYLDAQAQGWDWIGINLEDGGALMAFRIRGPSGEQRWAGGSYRNRIGEVQILKPTDIEFRDGRRWTSPRTGTVYPVAWQIRVAARDFELQPLMDDQENDTRLTTGAIYWEGAVRALDHGKLIGHGYLELTGYGEKLRLR